MRVLSLSVGKGVGGLTDTGTEAATDTAGESAIERTGEGNGTETEITGEGILTMLLELRAVGEKVLSISGEREMGDFCVGEEGTIVLLHAKRSGINPFCEITDRDGVFL
jgi:hypothetical protein